MRSAGTVIKINSSWVGEDSGCFGEGYAVLLEVRFSLIVVPLEIALDDSRHSIAMLWAIAHTESSGLFVAANALRAAGRESPAPLSRDWSRVRSNSYRRAGERMSAFAARQTTGVRVRCSSLFDSN